MTDGRVGGGLGVADIAQTLIIRGKLGMINALMHNLTNQADTLQHAYIPTNINNTHMHSYSFICKQTYTPTNAYKHT
jgi:hypothetical protein